jgi:stress response protein SCP2
MAISLEKGQKIDLTKSNPGLKNIIIGLGWDTNKYDGGAAFDLDSAAFLLNKDGKVGQDADFVFYNNTKGRNDSVIHTGDNKTGLGDGDDEQIKIDLSKVPADVEKMSFNTDTNDWAAYRIYVIEELKSLKDSLEKVKSNVEEIRGLVIETKTKVIGLTIGIPTVISLLIGVAQMFIK